MENIKEKVNSADWVNPTINKTKDAVLKVDSKMNTFSQDLVNNLNQYAIQKSTRRQYNIDPQVIR